MRKIFVTGMMLVALAAVVAAVVWLFYSQHRDDLGAKKAAGMGAPLDSIPAALPAPSDSAAAWSDTTGASID